MQQPPSRLEIGATLDSASVSPRQIFIVVLCFLIIAVDGFDTQAIAFVAADFQSMLGLSPAELGIVFSASTFAGVLAGLMIGPVADRTGRRPLIVYSTFAFSALTFLYIWVTTFAQLLALRALLGFVLAITISVTYSYAAEVVPKRFVARAVVFVTLGYSVGVALGGVLVSYLIPHFGWRSVFVTAGGLSVAVAMLALFFLPESIRFLVASGRRPDQVRREIGRAFPDLAIAPDALFYLEEESKPGLALRNVLAEGRARSTLPLWLCVLFLNMTLWMMTQWLPLLVTGMGGDIVIAARSVSIYTIGGIVGSLAFATAMDRLSRPVPILIVAFIVAAITFYFLSKQVVPNMLFLFLVAVSGFVVKGGQYSLNGLAAGLYPTYVRATGMALFTAVARFGAMLGPLVIGFVLASKDDPSLVFLIAAAPALISAAAVAYLSFTIPRSDKQTT